MAKITRKNQKIFGSSAGANQLAEFGSLAAGTPAYTTDPETIQALGNYLTGWFGAVLGANSPAIEDMNALCYLFAYQLAYIMQEGIAEWNASTTYYQGSLVNASGIIYTSQTDNNTNHAVTDTTNWLPKVGSQTFTAAGNFVAPYGCSVANIEATINPPGTRRLSSTLFGSVSGFMLDPNGSLYQWGSGVGGAIGNGAVTPASSPTLVIGGLKFQRVISAGQDYGASYGLTENGQVYAWGFNNNGQIGVGSVTNISTPTLVLGGQTFVDIAVGRQQFFGITSGGAVYACGNNTTGNLGNGNLTPQSTPVLVLGGLSFTKILSGWNATTFGLTTSGAAYSWGDDTQGILGHGTESVATSSPAAVLGGLTFADISLGAINGGGGAGFGITPAGAAYAWGYNVKGALGVGDTVSRSSPVLVLGGLTWKKIVCNQNGSVYGLTTSGLLYAWGQNNNGQLGVGDVVARSSPVLVLGGLTWQDIQPVLNSTTDNGAIGLTTAGVMYGWGSNTSGQLGVGDVAARSSPVLVLGGLTIAQIMGTRAKQVFAMTSLGVMYAWGDNTAGALGLGDVTPRSSPVLVLGGVVMDMLPRTQRMQVPITPGTTYAVAINQLFATFGGTVVAKGLVDSLKVSYE